MTHKDIYTKFMIEYDKANVTSSYPSLTEYEVATLLDKAYLALIAQKVTGNNPRRAPFEADNKAIADVQPLVTHKDLLVTKSTHDPAANIAQFDLPNDYLYTVQTMLNARLYNKIPQADGVHLEERRVYAPLDLSFESIDTDNIYVNWYETYENNKSADFVEKSDVYGDPAESGSTSEGEEQSGDTFRIKGNPMDKQFNRYLPVKLVTHEVAEKFFLTPYNLPWIKIPVSYVESNLVKIVYDSIKIPNVENGAVHFTYIRKPKSFVESLTTATDPGTDPTPGPSPNPPVSEELFVLDVSILDGSHVLGSSQQTDLQNGGNNQQNNNQSTNNNNQLPENNLDQNQQQEDVYSVSIDSIENLIDGRYQTNTQLEAYGQSNISSIKITPTKNNKQTLVSCSVVDGQEYVSFLSSYGSDSTQYYNTLISVGILPAASDWKNVTLRMRFADNYDIYRDFTIRVKYYSFELNSGENNNQEELHEANENRTVLYDFILKNTVYPVFERTADSFSQVIEKGFSIVSKTVPLYTTNKEIEFRHYNNNDVIFKAVFKPEDVANYNINGAKYAIKSECGPTTGNVRHGERYVWVIPEGTFGDYNFANNVSGESHANGYFYYFVDME